MQLSDTEVTKATHSTNSTKSQSAGIEEESADEDSDDDGPSLQIADDATKDNTPAEETVTVTEVVKEKTAPKLKRPVGRQKKKPVGKVEKEETPISPGGMITAAWVY